jgi:hypothetical protein
VLTLAYVLHTLTHAQQVFASALASSLSGVICSFLTQPFDTIKTVVQADVGIAPRRFPSTAAVVKHMVQTQVCVWAEVCVCGWW